MMKLLEEKISWILKLEKNSEFKKTDQISSFELGPWILFADYYGAKLFLKTIEDEFYVEHKVLYFLSQLPDTEEEFNAMVLKIVREGEPVEDRIEVGYYRKFMNLYRCSRDINSLLERKFVFDLKSSFNKKERLKVSVLKVLRNSFLEELKFDFIFSTLWFEFWYVNLYFIVIIFSKEEFRFLEFLIILSSVLLFCTITHYIKILRQNKKIKTIFNSIDELGIDFYKTDFEIFLKKFLKEAEIKSILNEYCSLYNVNFINLKKL